MCESGNRFKRASVRASVKDTTIRWGGGAKRSPQCGIKLNGWFFRGRDAAAPLSVTSPNEKSRTERTYPFFTYGNRQSFTVPHNTVKLLLQWCCRPSIRSGGPRRGSVGSSGNRSFIHWFIGLGCRRSLLNANPLCPFVCPTDSHLEETGTGTVRRMVDIGD